MRSAPPGHRETRPPGGSPAPSRTCSRFTESVLIYVIKMDDATRVALETMKAYREARDKSTPGTARYAELDKKYKEAEATYYKIRFEEDG
jgi:hypothetical protein